MIPSQKQRTPVKYSEISKPVLVAENNASTNYLKIYVSCQNTSLLPATIAAIKNIPIHIRFKSISEDGFFYSYYCINNSLFSNLLSIIPSINLI